MADEPRNRSTPGTPDASTQTPPEPRGDGATTLQFGAARLNFDTRHQAQTAQEIRRLQEELAQQRTTIEQQAADLRRKHTEDAKDSDLRRELEKIQFRYDLEALAKERERQELREREAQQARERTQREKELQAELAQLQQREEDARKEIASHKGRITWNSYIGGGIGGTVFGVGLAVADVGPGPALTGFAVAGLTQLLREPNQRQLPGGNLEETVRHKRALVDRLEAEATELARTSFNARQVLAAGTVTATAAYGVTKAVRGSGLDSWRDQRKADLAGTGYDTYYAQQLAGVKARGQRAAKIGARRSPAPPRW